MNEKEFIKAVQALNLVCDAEILDQLNNYYDLLVNWNKKFNLTSILDKKECFLKHFYDSLTVIKIVDLEGNLLDIGTGAGFPGIVLKIFFKDLKVDLLDSNNKKIDFLNFIIQELKLTKIKAINNRAEIYAKSNFEKYDIVISRAVAPLNILAELCLPLVKVNGFFIAMKGKIVDEIADGEYAINLLGAKITDIKELKLPILNHDRTLIKAEKVNHTLKAYPRDFNKIVKKPLKKNKL